MVTVEFLGPIGIAPITMEARTLAEVAKALQETPEARPWLASCAVAVNDTMTADLSMPLADGDRISLLPPVCGG